MNKKLPAMKNILDNLLGQIAFLFQIVSMKTDATYIKAGIVKYATVYHITWVAESPPYLHLRCLHQMMTDMDLM